ncbi:hypothetical protein CCACVL1_18268 [Corchorus capsularis]|uniref:Uncharacterized protein n=1 Tax=Corchorus capsularis TaxID=210143 RepID=A0A1R3HM53_COCAP|nr:hypothetical protein CCACVL1_18268 [Corchorus capsularis]
MSNHRSWMYHRLDEFGYVSTEFKRGVEDFLEFAFNHTRRLFPITSSDLNNSVLGETGRGHLYGFGSFQNPRAILEGSSRQNPTNHSNVPAEIPEAMQELFQKWLSEKLPGMLNSWGYHPSANASANNSTISASSRGNEVLQSSQNDSEKTASDGDNDDYPEDLC